LGKTQCDSCLKSSSVQSKNLGASPTSKRIQVTEGDVTSFQTSLPGDEVITMLDKLMASSQINQINLNGNVLTTKVLGVLVNKLPEMNLLTSLRLDGALPFDVGEESSDQVISLVDTCFNHSTLETLSLNNNGICHTQRGIDIVCKGVKNNGNKLKELSLNDRHTIQGEHRTQVLLALEENRVLEEFSFVVPLATDRNTDQDIDVIDRIAESNRSSLKLIRLVASRSCKTNSRCHVLFYDI